LCARRKLVRGRAKEQGRELLEVEVKVHRWLVRLPGGCGPRRGEREQCWLSDHHGLFIIESGTHPGEHSTVSDSIIVVTRKEYRGRYRGEEGRNPLMVQKFQWHVLLPCFQFPFNLLFLGPSWRDVIGTGMPEDEEKAQGCQEKGTAAL
jgi:hypothetical protein